MAMTISNTNISIGQDVSIVTWTETQPAGSGANPVLGTATRNVMIDAMVGQIDAGAGAGYVEIRQGAAVLVTIPTDDPAFAAAAAGTAAAAGLPLTVAATGAGVADEYEVFDSNDVSCWSGSVS